ncbi:MAG TPA: alanine--tRNA ligase [Opitutus sp.]|nr:alanine--tRNA ligase [Opitutus sp.]
MTSAEIRQSFLDFFQQHGHTIVRSSPLLPESPGLLFTNAGMNQFVPIFLGDRAPDVSRWGDRVLTPAKDTRAADTQKCIRAGGKHNDLEDVGFDTYHHTFFEMLGNWSFGDYFKRESLEWGWELLTKVWGIPAKRLFATVYSPDKSKGDPADFDQEAYDIWAKIFKSAGLDPAVHIVNGNKKDNFWMMGDTGPCGPCSEIHFNLLPSDDEAAGRALVNAGVPRCIEIWNHVFIQFNANADGTFSPLAAKHVDTGMGFERVAGIYATTNGFKTFTRDPSNYAADIFAPLFAKIAELSGKTYAGTVPQKREGLSEQENTDIAFRVLADHARCVSCAIADGILPGNEGRNYVIRRILRRGILYGKKLGLNTGFFEQLVTPVVESLGAVFPELKQQQDIIQRVIRAEEESFGRTIDRGLKEFQTFLEAKRDADHIGGQAALSELIYKVGDTEVAIKPKSPTIPGAIAFILYDTYGFPLDMTQLLAAERGLTVDVDGFNKLMTEQQERSRAAQKKDIIVAAVESDSAPALPPSKFLGYDRLTAEATVTDVVKTDKATFLVFDQTPFYAEMGGQAGDHGAAKIDGQNYAILDVVKDKSGRHLHELAPACALDISKLPDAGRSLIGKQAQLGVSPLTRRAISRHHTAAHLIHWALRKVLGTHVRQAGTSKTKHRLRFDFVHFEQVKPEQLHEIERLVNDKILENAPVWYAEVPYAEVKGRPDILQFFGDKYGDVVRVVQIGGESSILNGYSMELCGGTHVTTTGEIGLIKIVAEMAIAAGTRRIEAVAGQPAYDYVLEEEEALKAVSLKLNAGSQDVTQKLDSVLAHAKELEKKLKAYEQKAAAGLADDLAAKAQTRDGLKFVTAVVTTDSPESLRSLGSQVLSKIGEGVVTLGAAFGEKASVVAFCSPAAVKAGHQAGKLVSALSVQLGGKGGGKPDFAMGGGRDVAKLAEVVRA